MLPYFADFAAVSGSSGKPGGVEQRQAAAEWLGAILELAKSKLPNAITEQVSSNINSNKSLAYILDHACEGTAHNCTSLIPILQSRITH
jgi:hypothetical protein